jgi:hypothetical protein
MDTPERKVWGERRPKDRTMLQIILVFPITCLKTFTQGHVSVFDKYLRCPCVNDLHLHWIYMLCIYSYWHLPAQHWSIPGPYNHALDEPCNMNCDGMHDGKILSCETCWCDCYEDCYNGEG